MEGLSLFCHNYPSYTLIALQAMTLPPLSKWPTTSGFTFNTWLQIEKPYDSPREHYKPVVYWFRTGRQHGYSAHLVGSTLMLETVGKGGHKKPQTNAVNFVFQSYQVRC